MGEKNEYVEIDDMDYRRSVISISRMTKTNQSRKRNPLKHSGSLPKAFITCEETHFTGYNTRAEGGGGG